MKQQTYLSEYPDLEHWYYHSGLKDENINLFKFCRSLNTSKPKEVADNISHFFLEILVGGSIDQDIVNLESSCSLKHVNFQNLLVRIVENSIVEGCHESLYDTIGRVADKTAMPVYCFIAAWISFNLNDFQSCIHFCQKTKIMNSDFYGLLGQAYLENNEFQKSVECFESATESAPLEPMHWFWLAKCYYSLDNFDEAWISAYECSKLVPKDVEASVLLAIITCECKYSEDKVLKSWDSLWQHLNRSQDSGYILKLLFNLAFKMEDESKAILLIENTAFQYFGRSQDFMENLSFILRGLSQKGWETANLNFLEKYQQILT